ncbi:MAG: hypothetical protein CL431_00410 [Acidimicrobiaceae bacterium]|jgi:hypothetical protein|nr:hypothetical protein [Acidimicrobiaceae bacterium]|tara:strand:+ start:12189 stop:12611 length:423 start_codon:yes stop_codon:yes gene_type:complete
MYAAINSDGYNIVLLLHLFTVMVGTGSTFMIQFINAKDSEILVNNPAQRIIGFLVAPSLFLGGVFGGALVGLSDDVYDFSQLWLTIAGVVWLTACGSATLLFRPPFLTFPDPSHYQRPLTGILHLSLAVMLIVMVWKPGF